MQVETGERAFLSDELTQPSAIIDSSDFPMVLSLWLLLLVFAFLTDKTVLHWVGELATQGSLQRRIIKLSARSVQWWMFVALALPLALHRRRTRLLTGYALCVACCMGMLHILKFVVGRARPDLNLGTFYFCPFGDPVQGFDSFPSGHATEVLLLAVLGTLYFPWMRWVAFPLAVLVCISRLALERHFASDVIASLGLVLIVVFTCQRCLPSGTFSAVRFRTS